MNRNRALVLLVRCFCMAALAAILAWQFYPQMVKVVVSGTVARIAITSLSDYALQRWFAVVGLGVFVFVTALGTYWLRARRTPLIVRMIYLALVSVMTLVVFALWLVWQRSVLSAALGDWDTQLVPMVVPVEMIRIYPLGPLLTLGSVGLVAMVYRIFIRRRTATSGNAHHDRF